MVTNSELEAKKGAKGANTKAIIIRLKPHRVIKVANGTINTLANTVTGAKIIK